MFYKITKTARILELHYKKSVCALFTIWKKKYYYFLTLYITKLLKKF